MNSFRLKKWIFGFMLIAANTYAADSYVSCHNDAGKGARAMDLQVDRVETSSGCFVTWSLSDGTLDRLRSRQAFRSSLSAVETIDADHVKISAGPCKDIAAMKTRLRDEESGIVYVYSLENLDGAGFTLRVGIETDEVSEPKELTNILFSSCTPADRVPSWE